MYRIKSIIPIILSCLIGISACGGPVVNQAIPAARTGEGSDSTGRSMFGDWGLEIASMDSTVAPGDDFYGYVNGSWEQNYVMPDSELRAGSRMALRARNYQTIRDIIDELSSKPQAAGSVEKKIGDLYTSYMDKERRNLLGLSPLAADLKRIAEIRDYSQLAAEFGRSDFTGGKGPFRGYAMEDYQQPDRWIYYVMTDGIGLPSRDYYLRDDAKSAQLRDGYQRLVARFLKLANIEAAEVQAQAILALEQAIAERRWPSSDERNLSKITTVYRMDAMADEFPGFDWQAYFGSLNALDMEELIVSHNTAMNPIIEVINETPLETWKAFLTFHLISGNAGYLTDEIGDTRFAFYGEQLSGTSVQSPLWQRGLQLVQRTFGQALGKVYVERKFSPQAKTEVERMIGFIKQAFAERLTANQWMTAEAKTEAFKKLESFRSKVGYPEKWDDFSAYEVTSDNLIANVQSARRAKFEKRLANLKQLPDPREWVGMLPQANGAGYHPALNEMTLPAGNLQPPFFDINADPAINYGAIGGVIAHELSHAFDDQGGKTDSQGRLRNWWSAQDRLEFDKRSAVLVEQYNQYEALPGHYVDGEFTLGENIGDLGGLSVALDAYRLSLKRNKAPVLDGFTGDQRVFLGWAQMRKGLDRPEFQLQRLSTDPHSPDRYRVNGVVRNIDDWYQAFGVRSNASLYLPEQDRVKIW